MESISNKFKLPAPFIVTEGENGYKDHWQQYQAYCKAGTPAEIFWDSIANQDPYNKEENGTCNRNDDE